MLDEVRGNTEGRTRRWWDGDTSYEFTEIWALAYPPNVDILFIAEQVPSEKSIMPNYIRIDWGFVTAVLLSFMGILFTFDSISGEQERGTLRLMLSNSISRSAVICGKFLGAFFTIAIPFLFGTIVSIFHHIPFGSRSVQRQPLGTVGFDYLCGVDLYLNFYFFGNPCVQSCQRVLNEFGGSIVDLDGLGGATAKRPRFRW